MISRLFARPFPDVDKTFCYIFIARKKDSLTSSFQVGEIGLQGT